jgi:hypothetical protein
MGHCVVSFLDTGGLRHSVEVQAEGLYEATVLGLAAFKKHEIELSPNGIHTLDVEVRSSITHNVPVRKVYQWLQQGVRTPKEAVLKERLRALL